LLTEQEEEMMLETYAWENNTMNINYFKMNTDVNRSGCSAVAIEKLQTGSPSTKTRNKFIPIGTEDLLQPSPLAPISKLQEIKSKVQKSM
jgi:hypothetical protein